MLRSLAILMIVLASFPLIFMAPHVGVLVWTWFSYMFPNRMMYGFATYFPFLDVVAALTALSWLFSREPKKLPMHPILLPFILFVIWINITTLASFHPEISELKLGNTMKAVIYTTFVYCLINSRHRIEALILVICAALGYLALKGAVFTIATGGGHNVMGPVGTFIEDRNALAMVLAMVIPLARYVSLHAGSKLIRLLAVGLMLCCAVSILGTQSRGGLLSLLVIGFWLIMMSRRRGVILVACLVMGGFAVNFMPQSWKDRMSTIETYDQDASAQGRLDMWRYAMELTEDRPFTGGGFRIFTMRDVASQYLPPGMWLRASHSIYFEVLAEHGYVGLFLFILLIATALVTLQEVKRLTRNDTELIWARDLAQMCQASIVCFMVGGAFLEVAFAEIFLHLMALSAILHRVVLADLSSRTVVARDRLTGAIINPAPQPAE